MSQNDFRIIVIDDNPAIHQDFIKILKNETTPVLDSMTDALFGEQNKKIKLPEFEIDVASQGQEGVDLIKQAQENGKPYALAFIDMRMPPGLDGVETIKLIREFDQEIQVVICTAYSDYSWEETIEHLGKSDNLLILKKPFDNVSVRQIAFALTRKWQLAKQTKQFTSLLREQVAAKTVSLQETRSLVKSTFEASSDGIVIINHDGNILEYNQKFVIMLQMPNIILESEKFNKVFEYWKKELVEPEKVWMKLKNYKSNEKFLITIKLKNNKILECYSQPHAINNINVGRILDFRDVTDLKQTERLKNEFISVVSHELRTPLTAINGAIELLASGTMGILPTEANELIQIASKNCQRLLFLIRDILDMEKIANDKLSFRLQLTNINDIVHKAIENNAGYASKFGVALEFVPANNMIVNIDAERLLQVLGNLISNACKFSPEGESITITIQQHKNRVRVAVIDKGPGMSLEFQKKIFDRFSQEDSSDSRRKGGSGLGLHISKLLIEKMGGELNFYCHENRGTTFFFELPIYQASKVKNTTE